MNRGSPGSDAANSDVHLPRLGVLLPAANVTIESELPLAVAGCATCHFQRMQPAGSLEDLDHVRDLIMDAARVLGAARVEAIGLGYATPSLLAGRSWDELLRESISEATGRPTSTAASAAVDALVELGVDRVAVASPYSAAVNERLREYLAASGIEVTSLAGDEPSGPRGDVPFDQVRALALSSIGKGARGILISCTGLRTAAVIEDLEAVTGLPVVSSNQALLGALLRSAGIRTRIGGFGQLLAQRDETPAGSGT